MPFATTTEFFGIPLWLILFVLGGFLLFLLKISGDQPAQEPSSRLRLFLLIAVVLFAIAGIADFVKWASGAS